jgi:hypothetical protein
LSFSPNVVRVTRWVGHVVSGKMRCIPNLYLQNLNGRNLGPRWENDIKLNLKWVHDTFWHGLLWAW